LVTKALSTTHEEAHKQVREQRRKTKQRTRKRAWESDEMERLARGKAPRVRPKSVLPLLNDEESRRVAEGMPTTSLIDYMWRLRIRSNYEDDEMFTDGPFYPTDSLMVYKNVCEIVSATLLAYELYLIQYVGKESMKLLVKQWLSKNTSKHPELGLNARSVILFTDAM
jgi:hypothetical protein